MMVMQPAGECVEWTVQSEWTGVELLTCMVPTTNSTLLPLASATDRGLGRMVGGERQRHLGSS